MTPQCANTYMHLCAKVAVHAMFVDAGFDCGQRFRVSISRPRLQRAEDLWMGEGSSASHCSALTVPVCAHAGPHACMTLSTCLWPVCVHLAYVCAHCHEDGS
jgi:hypothetical protein